MKAFKAWCAEQGRVAVPCSLRAGGATDLAENGATDEELEEAGRWAKGSSISRKV